jgi:hypothetical protein
MKHKKYLQPVFGFSTSWDEKPKSVGDNKPGRGYATRVQFRGIGDLDSYQQEMRKERAVFDENRSTRIEYSPAGELFILNRGRNGAGLWVCHFCGKMWEYPPLKNDIKHKNKFGKDCAGKMPYSVSLGHTFSTDILRIELPIFFPTKDVKDVPTSVLYALLDGASDTLGIQRSDINGCLDYNGVSPAIVLFDDAAGGAGHMKHIFDDFERVCKAAIQRVDGHCGCSEETSCYGCLRNYSNQYEHEHLTRGGAYVYLKWLINNERCEE